MYLAQHNL